MQATSLRRALYVLFARLLAAPPDRSLYARLRDEGFVRLAEAQGIDLTGDLLDERDEQASALELEIEYAEVARQVSLRASDYSEATEDPVVALDAFLREHGLVVDREAALPVDHLAIALGVMAELSDQHEREGSEEARVRAGAFLHRHILPWADRALAAFSAASGRLFYRGLAAMVGAYLAVERATYRPA